MGRPGEVTADGDAQVLAGIYRFQCWSMEKGAGYQDFSLLAGQDTTGIAFAWVEFHLP